MHAAMPFFSILGPDDRFPTAPVLAAGPLDALAIYHRDGLMSRAVRLRNGRIEFRDRADQELCQGPWEVSRHTRDSPAATLVAAVASFMCPLSNP